MELEKFVENDKLGEVVTSYKLNKNCKKNIQ